MNSANLLQELQLARELVSALAGPLADEDLRRQYHTELSPLGWHLGHCTWTECYWLQQTVLGDDRYTAPLKPLYTPTLMPKPERGEHLPEKQALQQWVDTMQAMNLDLLTSGNTRLSDHPLMQQDYLLHFLLQHYNQHYESMLSVLAQRALRSDPGDFTVDAPLVARAPRDDTIDMQPGHYLVGGSAPLAYDNELPAQQATLGPYRVARRPVTNSEYLGFMEAGGYGTPSLWDEPGLEWLNAHTTRHPDHWRRDAAGHWYGTGIRGAYALDADEAVHGLSHHEARAYARWAGGRLPHEHQWEVACRLQMLEHTGRAWEWCENTFYPYAGFSAFPYEGYSTPAFDGRHYTLRGGSLHTRPAIRRPAFRNFHEPGKRHIFAGLRLVY